MCRQLDSVYLTFAVRSIKELLRNRGSAFHFIHNTILQNTILQNNILQNVEIRSFLLVK